MNSIPQTAATTFAFSSVCFFSMMLACLRHLNQKPICFTNRADLLRVMTGGGCEIKINVCSRARMRRSDKICVQRIYVAGARLGKGDGKTYFSSYGRLGRSDGKTYSIYVRGRKAWVEIAPQHLFSCRRVRLGKSYCETQSYAAGKGLEKLHQKTIFFALVKVWKGLS